MTGITAHILLFAGGLFLLIWGSSSLIQGCVKLAQLFKLTPLFIGIVLVAFGTSTPELAVGVIAALKGEKAIALGNIVGSNISNIGLILGVTSLLLPLVIKKSIFKRELPLMLIGTNLLFLLCWDLVLSRADGVILLLLFVLFCRISYRGAKQIGIDEELDGFHVKGIFKAYDSRLLITIISCISLGVVIFGTHLMVYAGASLAKLFGVSSWIIGITIFAVGTSLPELAASLTAAVKKIPSISVGNIVGSNIFNILLVLGIVAFIRPITIADSSIRYFEFPVLVAFSCSLYIFMRTSYRLSRLEGASLLAGYVAFLIFLLRRCI